MGFFSEVKESGLTTLQYTPSPLQLLPLLEDFRIQSQKIIHTPSEKDRAPCGLKCAGPRCGLHQLFAALLICPRTGHSKETHPDSWATRETGMRVKTQNEKQRKSKTEEIQGLPISSSFLPTTPCTGEQGRTMKAQVILSSSGQS